LVERFGAPEDAFGPNMRFRFAAIALGLVLVVLGVGFFVAREGFGPVMVPFAWSLSAGLTALGGAAIYFPLTVRRTWLFICPGGIVRGRGEDWDGLDWFDAVRFQDMSLEGGGVAVRQCRIITADGAEWGFLADWVADYDRLVTVLRGKVGGSRIPNDINRMSGRRDTSGPNAIR
jgi:hypothetical protein